MPPLWGIGRITMRPYNQKRPMVGAVREPPAIGEPSTMDESPTTDEPPAMGESPTMGN